MEVQDKERKVRWFLVLWAKQPERLVKPFTVSMGQVLGTKSRVQHIWIKSRFYSHFPSILVWGFNFKKSSWYQASKNDDAF